MKLFVIFILLLGKTILAQQLSLDNDNVSQTSKYDLLELGTIIIDETQSKLGADFFDLFYTNWDAYSEFLQDKSFQIIISEKPMRGIGTQISVKIDDTEIFQQFLQPRLELIQELAVYAAQYTAEYISNYENIQKDLQGEDLIGSGIY